MLPERISLDDRHNKLIERLVKSGRFTSASDVVARGLELLDEREAEAAHFLNDLEREVELGLSSGKSAPMESAGDLISAFRRDR